MKNPREEARAWVLQALFEELRDDSAAVALRALNLLDIAEINDIPVEELIRWIHAPAEGKRWTLAEWVRHAEEYVELREQYGTPQDQG